MKEHALFIRGLLDPTEEVLIETADDFSKDYKRLLEMAKQQDYAATQKMTNASLNETLNMWYADKEYDACLIQSFGNMRNHRYHDLFGVIIIEPANARWYKNFSLCKTIYDEAAVITAPGIESFRECVVVTQNGIRMLDKNNQLVKTTAGEDG